MGPKLTAALWAVLGGAVGAAAPLAAAGIDGQPLHWDRIATAAGCGAIMAIAALFQERPK